MSADDSTRFVNKSELACLLKKSLFTIDAWIRKGMPAFKKGSKTQEWQFDVSEVVDWQVKQATDAKKSTIENKNIKDLKKRKLIVEIGILENDLEKKKNEVVNIKEVEQAITHVCITVKQRLRTIPERIQAQLAAESSEIACGELLLYEIDDALLELSQMDFDGPTPQ